MGNNQIGIEVQNYGNGKGLKYPQSIGYGIKLPSINLLAPKYPSHPPIGSKIPLSSSFGSPFTTYLAVLYLNYLNIF